jgi:hypothetical protein
MTDVVETNRTRKRPSLRVILLLLTVVTSPLCLCGVTFLLSTASPSFLNFFHGEARVENRSGETLYITPITTTYGHPVVIGQFTFIRQRDIPIQPDHFIVLTYDTADAPLSGIAVCRTNDDCRLLAADHLDVYYLDSFESLPSLEPGWLSAIRSHPPYSFQIIVFPILGLLPVVLFSSWLYLVVKSRSNRGDAVN